MLLLGVAAMFGVKTQAIGGAAPYEEGISKIYLRYSELTTTMRTTRAEQPI